MAIKLFIKILLGLYQYNAILHEGHSFSFFLSSSLLQCSHFAVKEEQLRFTWFQTELLDNSTRASHRCSREIHVFFLYLPFTVGCLVCFTLLKFHHLSFYFNVNFSAKVIEDLMAWGRRLQGQLSRESQLPSMFQYFLCDSRWLGSLPRSSF